MDIEKSIMNHNSKPNHMAEFARFSLFLNAFSDIITIRI